MFIIQVPIKGARNIIISISEIDEENLRKSLSQLLDYFLPKKYKVDDGERIAVAKVESSVNADIKLEYCGFEWFKGTLEQLQEFRNRPTEKTTFCPFVTSNKFGDKFDGQFHIFEQADESKQGIGSYELIEMALSNSADSEVPHENLKPVTQEELKAFSRFLISFDDVGKFNKRLHILISNCSRAELEEPVGALFQELADLRLIKVRDNGRGMTVSPTEGEPGPEIAEFTYKTKTANQPYVRSDLDSVRNLTNGFIHGYSNIQENVDPVIADLHVFIIKSFGNLVSDSSLKLMGLSQKLNNGEVREEDIESHLRDALATTNTTSTDIVVEKKALGHKSIAEVASSLRDLYK